MEVEFKIRLKTPEEKEWRDLELFTNPKCFFCSRSATNFPHNESFCTIAKWFNQAICSGCIGTMFRYYGENFYDFDDIKKPLHKRKRVEFMQKEQDECVRLNKLNRALKNEIRMASRL